MRAWTIVFLAVNLAGTAASGQRGATPPVVRDGATAPSSAAAAGARISGRVVSAEGGRPLRRVTVQLSAGNLQTDRWTLTDADGSWTFAQVLPGTYTITASRDGYVTMAYGQKGAFGTPARVSVAADRTLATLDITLPPGGVISGRILDDVGDPLGGALVQAMRLMFVDGFRQLVPAVPGLASLTRGGLTDDRGEYRIHGLAPGTYYLAAAYGQTAPGRSDDRLGYPTTYYPGTAQIAAATAVKVAAGEAVAASFALSTTALAEVSGRVVNSLGESTLANVSLVAVAPGHAIEAGTRLSAASSTGGAFTIKGVPAGNYFLQARSGAGGGNPEVVASQIAVAGQDVRDIVVTTARTGSVSGRLRLEDAPDTPIPDGFFIAAMPASPGAMSARPGSAAQARANNEGTFMIGGISGRHVLRLRSAPAGWWLRSVTIDGVDVTDAGLDFLPNQAVAVDIVATRRVASQAGVVQDANGQRVSEYSVVAFSPDESRWGPRTRFILATTPQSDGAFTLDGLIPGEYVVVAVPPLEAGDETDPERLARWRSEGRRLLLGNGQAPPIRLTIGR